MVYKDEEKGSIVDEVKEKELVYAASCPVTVSGSSEDESEIEEVEGTVLLSKPSPDDPKSIQYTVMLPVGGSYARYEDGIDAKRIKYRKEVLVPNTKSGECDLAQSVWPSLTRNKQSTPPVSANLSNLKPTIKKKPNSKGKHSAKRAQGKCIMLCGRESTTVCSLCTHPTDPMQKQFWVCSPVKSGCTNECFANHIKQKHSASLKSD